MFGFMLKNLYKKIVMAFTAKNLTINDKVEEPLKVPLPSPNLNNYEKVPLPSPNLNKYEVEILLIMIKEAHFKGEHVQKIYELTLKLQNYYTQLP